MKAAIIMTTGKPDIIHWNDVANPIAGSGQVLVRTEAVAVNPIDTYIRAGIVKAVLPKPYIIGGDIAGVVESVGPHTQYLKPGDRVWGSNQGLAGRQGTFAELCAIDEQWLYPIPGGVSSESAAAGALVGITAHLGLFLHGGLRAGETVFVNGGTGGVGSAVLQLARAAGATVITTAGSAEKVAACQRLGAAHVIAYRTEDIDRRFAEITATTGPIQLWFETLRTPSLDRCFSLMAPRGRVIFMAGRDARPEFPVGPFYVKDLRAIGFAMFNASSVEQRVAAMALNPMLADGRYKPLIGARLPLSDAAKAHQLQEDKALNSAGTLMGKIVLKP
ncbi:MAG: NADPH:quinone reductase [Planctomycetales bacterium]|nr:NADPH:quinone reductase [Planctomycetales bacterium]